MDDNVRVLPRGTKLKAHGRFRVGDDVIVHGWRYPGSRDQRRIVDLLRQPCQTGVMAVLNRPLQNQGYDEPMVDLAWFENRTGWCEGEGRV